MNDNLNYNRTVSKKQKMNEMKVLSLEQTKVTRYTNRAK